MDNEDILAELAFKSAEKEMRLRRIVTQSATDYWFQGRIIAAFLGMTIFVIVVMLIDSGRPVLSPVFALLLPTVIEVNRQRERFDALIKLMEVEKFKSEANKQIQPIAGKTGSG